jgi:hypothetical protein
MLGIHKSARLVVCLRMGLCELADHSLANEQQPFAILVACLSSVRALARRRRARETLSPPRPPPMHPLLCARVVLRFSAPHKTCLCSYAILAECVKPHILQALAGTEPLRLPAEVSLHSRHSGPNWILCTRLARNVRALAPARRCTFMVRHSRRERQCQQVAPSTRSRGFARCHAARLRVV